MKKRLFAITFLMMLLSWCSAVYAIDVPNNISVHVVDHSGNPLSGVEVFWYTGTGNPDVDGWTSFNPIAVTDVNGNWSNTWYNLIHLDIRVVYNNSYAMQSYDFSNGSDYEFDFHTVFVAFQLFQNECTSPTITIESDGCFGNWGDPLGDCGLTAYEELFLSSFPAYFSWACGNDSHTCDATATEGAKDNNNTEIVQCGTPSTISFTCPPPIFEDANESDGWAWSAGALGTPTASGGNGSITIIPPTAPNPFPIGETTLIWTATDGCNTATCSQVVTIGTIPIQDLLVLVCPGDLEKECPWSPTTGDDLGTPDVSGGTPPYTISNDAPSSFPLGETIVTWTASDAAGNTLTCTQAVNIFDDIPPQINCPNPVLVYTGPDSRTCGAVAIWENPFVSDNCGTPTLSSTYTSGETFPVGTTTVTYTATDAAGNTATCSFDVTVIDNTPPVISGCPQDFNVYTGPNATICGAIARWETPISSDNCGTPTLTSTYSSGQTFPLGTTTVVYTATDAAGNTATCSFAVTVIDNTPPTITCPPDVNLSSCNASNVDLGSPTYGDNCSVKSVTNNANPPFALGTTTVIWTVTDGSGNTATCSQSVNVNEDSRLVINGCPQDVTVYVNATHHCADCDKDSERKKGEDKDKDKDRNQSAKSHDDDNEDINHGNPQDDHDHGTHTTCCEIATWTPPTVTNGCGGTVTATLTSNHKSGECFLLGSTTVTYTATNAAGNTATCSFVVTVIDNIPPVITDCPNKNIVVFTGKCKNNDDDKGDRKSCTTDNNGSCNIPCSAKVTWDKPHATDNCCGATLTSTYSSGSTFPVGTTTVVYTATDASGNTATCSFTVTVIDNTPPQFAGCPNDIKVYTGTGRTSCDQVATWTAPTATDNCGVPTVTSNYSPGATFPVGKTTVTYTATDGAGNSSTCSFDVTVVDNTPPTISVTLTPNNLSQYQNHSMVKITPVVTVSDNCCVRSWELNSIKSNQADKNLGTGDLANDIQNTSSGIYLRAETYGSPSRVYTFCYTVYDCHGNSTKTSATVTVPTTPAGTLSGSRLGDNQTDYSGIDFGILNIYPNPFESNSTISYIMPENTQAVIAVYNSMGEKVKTLIDGVIPQGANNLLWDGKDDYGINVSNGVYFIQMTSGSNTDIKSVVIIK